MSGRTTQRALCWAQVCGQGPATTPEKLSAALFDGLPGSQHHTVQGMLHACSYGAANLSLAGGSEVIRAVIPIPCKGTTPWGTAYDSTACPFTGVCTVIGPTTAL